MKKIALTIIVSLVTIVGQAQEHLRFMGIPIEGTVEQFANRLVTENLFQSDGIHSYLNGCVFIMDAKSLSDAKKKQKMLYKKLSDKYFMLDDTDSNGNKFYYGGYPPTPDDGVGFSIEILKYDSELARLYSPYATRLAYGRYNYVKEEF